MVNFSPIPILLLLIGYVLLRIAVYCLKQIDQAMPYSMRGLLSKLGVFSGVVIFVVVLWLFVSSPSNASIYYGTVLLLATFAWAWTFGNDEPSFADIVGVALLGSASLFIYI